jgi:3-carboxy-cis,cis-muconate cycloisomerase
MDWHDSYATTAAMSAIFSDQSLLRYMCRFEAELARAQGRAGLLSAAHADIIANVAQSLVFDLPSLFETGAKSGTLALPLVKVLTQEVRNRDADAAAWVHFGATSQDVIDSALIMQLADALKLLDADLHRLADGAAHLAQTNAETYMLGRTLMQPATPITFGLKASQWLLAVCESWQRLQHLAPQALCVQLGGAAGTLGSLGLKGADVAKELASVIPFARDKSMITPVPWHTRRGALLALCSEVAILTGSLSKIARDIALMMQYEIGEAREPSEAGRGGSSAMPHKRNPVRCMLAVHAGLRTPHLVSSLMGSMIQEHERALGGWQAEWAVIPELFKLAAGAALNMADCLSALDVDEGNLARNLDALKGLPMTEQVALALAPVFGKTEAFALVEAAAQKVSASDLTLFDVLCGDERVITHIDRATLERITTPSYALGATKDFIATALLTWEGMRISQTPSS